MKNGKLIFAAIILITFSLLFSSPSTMLFYETIRSEIIIMSLIFNFLTAVFFLTGFFVFARTRHRLVKKLIISISILFLILFLVSISDGTPIILLASFIGLFLLLLSLVIISKSEGFFITHAVDIINHEITTISWFIIAFSVFGILQNVLLFFSESIIKPKGVLITSLILNLFECCMGIYILRFRDWARKIYAVLVPVFLFLVVHFNIQSITNTPFNATNISLRYAPSILFYIFSLWVLFRPQAAVLFGSTRRIL